MLKRLKSFKHKEETILQKKVTDIGEGLTPTLTVYITGFILISIGVVPLFWEPSVPHLNFVLKSNITIIPFLKDTFYVSVFFL